MIRFDRSLIPPLPDLSLEKMLWSQGVQTVAGIDEAGRGALAGPVAAAALILPVDSGLNGSLEGLRDSKLLSPAARETWSIRLKEIAITWGIGFASNQEIDAMGIISAVRLAAWRALNWLSLQPEHILLDCLFLQDHDCPQTSLIKGDARSLSIAGASILAKTGRDALLQQLDCQHPGYDFAGNKGYCTRAHVEALLRLGPSPVHRFSFAPVRDAAGSDLILPARF